MTSNSLQFSKDSIYLDIHNSAFPNGEIRGQVGLRAYSGPVITVGIPENKNDAAVNLMPNPTQNKITINTIDKPICSIEVITMVGQLLHRTSFNQKDSETTATVDLSNYVNGIYLIRINGSDFSVQKKIVKE